MRRPEEERKKCPNWTRVPVYRVPSRRSVASVVRASVAAPYAYPGYRIHRLSPRASAARKKPRPGPSGPTGRGHGPWRDCASDARAEARRFFECFQPRTGLPEGRRGQNSVCSAPKP